MDTSRPAFWSLTPVTDPTWQMAYGERFALDGLLSHLRPALAVETGTAQGGSLRRIAAHAGEVHCFDIVPEVADVVAPLPNATAHIGDSAVLLPQVLAGFADAGRTVDFVLIDGDHTFEGVQRDLRAVLESPACDETTVVIHDTANEHVRAGLDAMDLPAHPKVSLCFLDFVPGYQVREGNPHYPSAWSGLGLLLLSRAHGAGPAQVDTDREDVARIYREWRAASAPGA